MGHRVAHRCHNENKKQSESKINDIDGPSRGPWMSSYPRFRKNKIFIMLPFSHGNLW